MSLGPVFIFVSIGQARHDDFAEARFAPWEIVGSGLVRSINPCFRIAVLSHLLYSV